MFMKKSIILFAAIGVSILLSTAAAMAADTAISAVKLIGGSQSEVNSLKSSSKKQGWTVIESNLNAGAGGDCIYLCYMKASGSDSPITGLYLSSGSNPVSGTISVNGRNYTLCPYEGGSHFRDIKGDLNSNAGGDDIHIYYTTEDIDGKAVTEIRFNSSSSGAVCKDKSSTPYDLNKGAGGDDIFMHVTRNAVDRSSSSIKVSGGISKIKLIGGSQSEVNSLKSSSKKQGWTVIESNLNAGAGGDCIYLCYMKASGSDSPITGLYLSSGSNPVSGTISVNGRNYTLCPYEGGSHFRDIKGDLNSNAGGDDIHIYYTTEDIDGKAVTEIRFNSSSSGAVCKDKSSTPYDLNKGAGGDDIFMHVTR